MSDLNMHDDAKLSLFSYKPYKLIPFRLPHQITHILANASH